MRKMDWVPQEDALLFDEDREKFDAIINRVKKFEAEHPNSFQFPVSDEDALVVCDMIGLEMEYEFAKRDIKNAKSVIVYVRRRYTYRALSNMDV